MKVGLLGIILLASASPLTAAEPILGGPCEGCEYVFVGQPDALESRTRIGPIGEPGETLVIDGVVRDSQGQAVSGIIIYAYQTNADGLYPSSTTRHGALRAWARTDKQGRYRFDTVRPGSYPEGSEPQHVHMHVIEPGRGTYYIDDIYFADDPKLTEKRRAEMRRGRGGLFDDTALERSAEGWRVRRDIVLGAGIDNGSP